MYQLSYFPNNQNVNGVQAYDKEVDELNQHTKADKVYIVCSKEQLDENGSMKIFSMIDKLSAELSVASDNETKNVS